MKKEWLVSVGWLSENLNSPNVVIVDTRLTEEYETEHIPRAAFVPEFYDTFVDTGKQGLANFHSQLENWTRLAGISMEDTVVCYEKAAGMRSSRAAWMLTYAGHPNACVLDGGLTAWKKRDLPTTREVVQRAASAFVPMFDESILATRDGTLRACERRESIIVDCRERDEFIGTDEFTCCPRRGRIPSSIWLYWREVLASDDASFRSDSEIREILEGAGIIPEKEIIIYCHRGARAANTWMALKRLGYPNVKNYIGSWHEWSAVSELPIATGEE